MKYDAKSMKAEEFIHDGEIRETVQYAKDHKDDLALIDEILEKAKKRKGLSHREIFTGTGSCCSRRSTCPITVSTGVSTVRII